METSVLFVIPRSTTTAPKVYIENSNAIVLTGKKEKQLGNRELGTTPYPPSTRYINITNFQKTPLPPSYPPAWLPSAVGCRG
jgi:hypothetical protein